jgi:hypothetical protein
MASAQRHKSFPNLTPTPNRLLAFKWDKTNYDGHRNRIQNIKSTGKLNFISILIRICYRTLHK